MDFPIVDTHVHLWDTRKLRYPWLDQIPSLNRPYLPADFRKACGPVAVEKMVFVQCEALPEQARQEAEWVSTLAAGDEPRIGAIIPFAPLEDGDAARPTLGRLAADPLVKGVRRLLQAEPDPEFCLRAGFVRGVQALAEYHLHFEICIFHFQMAGVIQLVAQCPNVSFMLDHIGKPGIRDGLLDPWRRHLAELAQFPNVFCKVSGLVTEADHERWTPEALRPYLDHVIDTFGFDRLMFGGDWPVASLATDYPRWVETLAGAVAGCTVEEQRNLFRENAIRFYRLG